MKEEMSLDKSGQITDFEYEGLAYTLPEGYLFKDENGNEILTSKIILEKKKEYPKTYKECCEVIEDFITIGEYWGYKHDLFVNFQKLILCRDAYWKLYGEEIGLDKPWEPDYTKDEKKYCIGYDANKLTTYCISYSNKIFTFPTTEMRDTFYKNFKKEIEFVKEFL